MININKIIIKLLFRGDFYGVLFLAAVVEGGTIHVLVLVD